MERKFKTMHRKFLIIIFLFNICALTQFSELSFASTPIEVTINPNKVIGTNNFSLGFQLDGSTIQMWLNRPVLRELARSANFKLVRLWSNVIEPCRYWDESTKTGTWYWENVDSLLRSIFEIGAEPLIVLGFYSWVSNSITTPLGMTKNPVTGLPYPDQWGAYCAQWVKHFKEVNLPVRYYEIINEPYHYWKEDGWPTAQPKTWYFIELFNAAAVSMRKENPKVQLGNDASIMKGVLDYFISHGERLDFLSYHGYATGSLTTTDEEILKAAETKYIGESASYYGVDKAKQLYKSAKGIDLPVIKSENNVNYCYGQGTDPRIQTMLGAVYQALTFRTFMIKNYSYNVYFHLASSASSEQLKPSGGAGFGMTNSDNNSPWYPYYVHKMLGQNLAVGDKIVESTSTSEDVRVVAWIHEEKLNVMLICKVDAQRTVRLQGPQGKINYSKLDNTISWQTPSIQSGSIDTTSDIILNGYTVMLFQGKPNSIKSAFEDDFESGSFSQWSGSSTTSGETANVVDTLSHHGSYSARFTTNGGGIERAYVYKNLDAQSELYVRGYFYIESGLPLQNNDNRFNLFSFMSGSNTIASLSVRRNGGADVWSITSIAGTWYASSGPVMDQWYCVEFYVKIDSSGGIFRMWVDGVLVIERTGLNTATVGNVNSVRTGLVYVNGVAHSVNIYGDCFALLNTYIGPEVKVAFFDDGFESGDFNMWKGTVTSYGETATVRNWQPHHGSFHGRFTSNGEGDMENAYCYTTIDAGEVYAKGYFYIARGLPLTDNGDRFYFLRFRAGSQSLAGVGIRHNGGIDCWVVYARSGSGWIGPIFTSSPPIETGRWYCIEFHWKRDASQGLVEMYIDGVEVLEIAGIDTAYFGNVDTIDFGLISVTDVQNDLIVYGDCLILSERYIGPEI